MQDKLTPGDIAEQMGVTPVTVRNWIRAGRLQGYRVGGRIYVRRDELERFLSEPAYPDEANKPEAAAGGE